MRTTATGVVAALLMCMVVTTAEAQTISTCSFDPASATVTVNVNGRDAKLLARQGSGEILLNAVPCGGATLSNTDVIQVGGGSLDDSVRVTGNFAPGLTAEPIGGSEIEIVLALGGGRDTVAVDLNDANNRRVLTSGGLDTGEDGDEDITTAGCEELSIRALGGHDTIDASAYTGTPAGGRLVLDGGSGNDRLIGDDGETWIFGGFGNDTLQGRGGNDRTFDGPDSDTVSGGAGNDRFYADGGSLDGSDVFRGDGGEDTVDYRSRTGGVTVTIGNGLADDGAPGEGDWVDLDIENVVGGKGDDVLVGSDRRNTIRGRLGNDEIYGGGSGDSIFGDDGNDMLFGEDGADELEGLGGDDILSGGAGADDVQCGAGTDEAEDDPLDTFSECEL